MHNSSPSVALAEGHHFEDRLEVAGLVYEHLCTFRDSQIQERRLKGPRTFPGAGSSVASHIFAAEADSTPLRKDTKDIDPLQGLDPALEEVTNLESCTKETSIKGSDVASQFAVEAASKLDQKELKLLLLFLTEQDTQRDPTKLHHHLADEIEKFRKLEASFTKEDENDIAQPAGDPGSNLGLILHCQSKEGVITKFWDEGSQTIQLLSGKGLSSDVVFAYDWHWRGEGRARGRKSQCPASQWKKEKLRLHNQMSHRLLEMLPLPLLVVAGSCAKKHYQEGRGQSVKELNVRVKDNVSIPLEILFQEGGVRRITAFVNHPAATMFNPNSAAEYAVRLDAALNFFMWLSALPHDELSFTKTASKFRKGRPGSAPLKEVHEYVKMEADLERPLTVLEYDPVFLNWASTTLREDVFKMLDTGESVAKALRAHINGSISKGLQQSEKFAVANRRRNAERYGFEFREYWDGQAVTLTAHGYISLHLSEASRALKILVPAGARKTCQSAQESNEKTVIYFTEAGVELRLEEDLVATLPIDQLQKQRGFGQEGVDQYRKELARKALALQQQQQQQP